MGFLHGNGDGKVFNNTYSCCVEVLRGMARILKAQVAKTQCSKSGNGADMFARLRLF